MKNTIFYLTISLREYRLITNKHNQKLITILENQKIFLKEPKEVFLKYWYFGFHFLEPIFMEIEKWNPKYQYFKKTSIDLLVFQYVI